MKQLFILDLNRTILCRSLLTIFLGLFSPLFVSAEVVDKIVAVVNDDVITLSELESEAAGLYRSIAQQSSDIPLEEELEKARNATLNGMIDQMLVDQRAKKYKVTVTEEEIDATYNGMLQKLSLTPAQFREKIEGAGMTEEIYRNKLKTQILQNKLLSYDVRSKIVITEEMILDYYDENYTSRVDKGSYYLLQMGFSWDTDIDNGNKSKTSKQESYKRAERVFNLVKSGQDFRSLAKQFSDLPSASDGGDIGTFTLDEMASSMRDAVAPLNPGEISEIIETSGAYQFFKMLSGEENAIVVTASYEEAKEEIKEKLYQEKLKDAYSEWVKKLKEDAYIQKL